MNFAPLWILLCFMAFAPGYYCRPNQKDALIYTREDLLSLRTAAGSSSINLPEDCSAIRWRDRCPEGRKKEQKKRGSRGGVRHRLWKRRNRFPLPVITLSNVRSVSNKLDELKLRAGYDHEFRQSNLVCLTETWL